MLLTIVAVIAIVALLCYLLPETLIHLGYMTDAHVLARYQSSPSAQPWAVVTGGSSGIGLALTKRLAHLGFNVAVVAYDDADLRDQLAALVRSFPKRSFKSVGVDFADKNPDTYIAKIAKATEEIDVRIVCLVAGVLHMKRFDHQSEEEVRRDIRINALAATEVTHHFFKRLCDERKKSCFIFLSSMCVFIPIPYSAVYAATKAFLDVFATTLYPEAKLKGIDVVSVHPGAVDTNLFREMVFEGKSTYLKRYGQSPDSVARIALASVGRFASIDSGASSVVFRILSRLIGPDGALAVGSSGVHGSGLKQLEAGKAL